MATTALPDRVLNDVVAVIRGLNLQGVATVRAVGTNVLKQMFLEEMLAALPAVVVTPAPEPEEEGEHTFEDDVVGYKALVLICDRQPGRDATPLPDYLAWRRAIAQTFRGMERLPSCPEVWNLDVKRLPVLDPKLPEYQLVTSGLTVIAWADETRAKTQPGDKGGTP